MVTYGCLALLVLLVSIKSIITYRQSKQRIDLQELDNRLLHLINDEVIES